MISIDTVRRNRLRRDLRQLFEADIKLGDFYAEADALMAKYAMPEDDMRREFNAICAERREYE